jgi:hypothetical protein
MEESPSTTWSGVPIRVSAIAVPRYAWLTISIDVTVHDRKVLRTGGVMKVLGVHTETVELAGARRRMDLSWGAFARGSFPFSLAIDGVVVLESRVAARYWWVAYWPYAALVALGAPLAHFA